METLRDPCPICMKIGGELRMGKCFLAMAALQTLQTLQSGPQFRWTRRHNATRSDQNPIGRRQGLRSFLIGAGRTLAGPLAPVQFSSPGPRSLCMSLFTR